MSYRCQIHIFALSCETSFMSKLVIVGTVAFDAIETPFGKTDKILGGAATYIGLAASQFQADGAIVSVVGAIFRNSTSICSGLRE